MKGSYTKTKDFFIYLGMDNAKFMTRFFLLLFIIHSSACIGQQQGKQQQGRIDTAKLFDPFPQTVEEGSGEEAVNMFSRSIILFKPGYYFLLKKQEHKLATERDVKRFIAGNKEEIQKSKVYIMTDSSTAFSKIISTISILKEQQVTDYRVINVGERFSPEPPLEITIPKSITTRPIDYSDYFSISLQKKKITVKLPGKSQKVQDFDALDKFITDNKSSINENKILIVQDTGTKYELFKTLTEVLKKHNYLKFTVTTAED